MLDQVLSSNWFARRPTSSEIGEDVSERLDVIPAQFRVLVTRRPKYACRRCSGAVAQAHAPEHVVPGGLPTEALIAQVIVAKFGDHLPFYRQSEIYARQGIALDRATLGNWVGRACFHLKPIADHMRERLASAERIFMDETTAPVLDPGRGQTKKGFFWAIACDDRGHSGPSPPVVLFKYAPGRSGTYAAQFLRGFRGRFLQCDGYEGYELLTRIKRDEGPWTLVHCWSHLRRRFVKLVRNTKSPIAETAVRHIAALYAIEPDVRGQSPEARLATRKKLSAPIVDALKPWFEKQLSLISSGSTLAGDINYALNYWTGLTKFLEDGRLELDTNPVENAIRPVAMRESLCTPSSSICKHWKRVHIGNATRAHLSGHRHFDRLRRQVVSADLVRRSANNLYSTKGSGFDKAPYRVVCNA